MHSAFSIRRSSETKSPKGIFDNRGLLSSTKTQRVVCVLGVPQSTHSSLVRSLSRFPVSHADAGGIRGEDAGQYSCFSLSDPDTTAKLSIKVAGRKRTGAPLLSNHELRQTNSGAVGVGLEKHCGHHLGFDCSCEPIAWGPFTYPSLSFLWRSCACYPFTHSLRSVAHEKRLDASRTHFGAWRVLCKKYTSFFPRTQCRWRRSTCSA